MAVLKLSGTKPVCMEVLMMLVMKGRSWGRNYYTFMCYNLIFCTIKHLKNERTK